MSGISISLSTVVATRMTKLILLSGLIYLPALIELVLPKTLIDFIVFPDRTLAAHNGVVTTSVEMVVLDT